MTSELELKFTSWNSRGLQKMKKVKQVMGEVKKSFFFKKPTFH